MAGTTPNIGLNIPDYGDHNWDVPVNQNWNTLDTAIAGKQATLTFDSTPTSGSSNPVTSGGVYSAIQAATPAVDNKSVDYNGSQQLETIGVIDRRDTSTAVKIWTGTKAQYEALKPEHRYGWTNYVVGNTIWTDKENPVIGDNVYAKEYVEEEPEENFEIVNVTSSGISIAFYDEPIEGLFVRDSERDVTGESHIDPNTLYNITDDTGEIYLGNTILSNYGANTNLSNLSSTGKNIANWSNNVTNCITEIPQDIKLELNNGILTLKAGSKVYVPNGFNGTTPKFDVITLTEDKSRIGSVTTTGTSMVCTYFSGEPFVYAYSGDGISQGYFSGPTAPTGHTYMVWYDTANNIIKTTTNGGSTWDSYRSFPIAIVSYSSDSSGFTSIDQVFNGFGYIGSTVFALPGVKGLIPNGRNEDGSLKNIEFTTSNMLTFTSSDGFTGDCYFCLNANYLERLRKRHYSYDKDKNINYIQGNISLRCFTGDIHFTVADKIDRVSLPQAFHALDYNDSSTISGWSMPSDRSIDLTLGASGASYTAPANGKIYWRKKASAVRQYIALIKTTNSRSVQTEAGVMWAVGANDDIYANIEVRKGEVFRTNYTAGGSSAAEYLRFVYAEGEQ